VTDSDTYISVQVNRLTGARCSNRSFYKKRTDPKNRFRRSTDHPLPTLTPGAMAWPKWHSAEPSHRVRIARHRACHEGRPFTFTSAIARELADRAALARCLGTCSWYSSNKSYNRHTQWHIL